MSEVKSDAPINNKQPDNNNNLASKLKNFDNITYLQKDWIIKNIPYFFFIVLLAIIYIWNSHHGVKMVKEMRDVEQELVQSQYYYNATKDTLTRKTRQSYVAEMVKDQNMYELSNPVYTIIKK